MLTAEIIAVGSELLTPHRTDTNSLWLTERLNSVGIEVKLKTIVGDDDARLEETIRDALKRLAAREGEKALRQRRGRVG